MPATRRPPPRRNIRRRLRAARRRSPHTASQSRISERAIDPQSFSRPLHCNRRTKKKPGANEHTTSSKKVSSNCGKSTESVVTTVPPAASPRRPRRGHFADAYFASALRRQSLRHVTSAPSLRAPALARRRGRPTSSRYFFGGLIMICAPAVPGRHQPRRAVARLGRKPRRFRRRERHVNHPAK